MKTVPLSIVCALTASLVFSQGKPSANMATKKTVLMGVQQEAELTLDESSGLCLLTGDYVVPKGSVLKICEGVKIIVSKRTSITIQGQLDIQGSKEKPVIFKPATSGYGAWDGIKLLDEANGEITFMHMSGAKEALQCEHANLRVWNSTFYRNEMILRTHEGHRAQFENCFCLSNKRGFVVHGTQFELDNCTIRETADAVTDSWGGSTKILKCTITKNGGGIGGCNSLDVHGSIICGNRKFDINNEGSGSGDCTGNFWGKQSVGILKKNGGTKLPTVKGNAVNLSDWLKEAPADCGAKDYPPFTLK